jgi:hypothetical protein
MYGKEARNEDKISRSEKAVSGSWTAQDIAALKGLHRWKAQVGTELLLKWYTVAVGVQLVFLCADEHQKRDVVQSVCGVNVTGL